MPRKRTLRERLSYPPSASEARCALRRSRPKATCIGALAALFLALLLPLRGEAHPVAELPDGFAQQVIATGITGATGMALADDGRVFVCEQTGALRVVKEGRLMADPFVVLDVDDSWERGLLGVALDPDFATTGYLYVVYVARTPYPHHVVSRFTASGDKAAMGSERILLEGDDQRLLGGSIPAGHQGGGIHVGPDGCLYISIGEQTAGSPAQELDTFQGKILRIERDGSIPADNPFTRATSGKYRAIWAVGLRNPFAFAFQPGTSRMFINDVGGSRWEEINDGVAGGNYGWPIVEGPSTRQEFQAPIHYYGDSAKKSITGAAFYPDDGGSFPSQYCGKYFFAEFMEGWIGILDPKKPGRVERFASGLPGPVDLRVAKDGSLYVLCRNAWVRDDQFRPRTSSLVRIFHCSGSAGGAPRVMRQPSDVATRPAATARFSVEAAGDGPLAYQWWRNGQPIPGAQGAELVVAANAADEGAEFRCVVSGPLGSVLSRPAFLWLSPDPVFPHSIRLSLLPQDLPPRLSGTGVFSSLRDLVAHRAAVPYDVNVPLWSDGAEKLRWIILPQQGRIGYARRGPWSFPAGTILVKHFELHGKDPAAPPRRLETRLLVVGRRGDGYGAAYRWRADASDADRVDETLAEEVPFEGERRVWTFPGPRDCLVCHTTTAGFVLGVNTRQVNRAIPVDRFLAGPHGTHGAQRAENQLAYWKDLGLFRDEPPIDEPARAARLVPLCDESAPIADRARSYLDANCSQCHHPGGVRGEFDARFETPLADQKLIQGPLVAADLGIEGAAVLVPGNRGRSMAWQRMARRGDVFGMPPLASHQVDRRALEVLQRWIDALGQSADP